MKTIDLRQQQFDLLEVIDLARQEPILLLTPDGLEFCLAEADDFEREVESLRQSRAFQDFLNARSECPGRIPLEEIETELRDM